MARADELGDDGGADPTGRAGDENTHEKDLHLVDRPQRRGRLMSVAVITLPGMSVAVIIDYDRRMVRWEPDSRGRLEQAALALYGERGFENTTVAEIAERAGLTERTFFRHFADKREVLFGGARMLQELLVSAVASAPDSAAPIDAVLAALESAGAL